MCWACEGILEIFVFFFSPAPGATQSEVQRPVFSGTVGRSTWCLAAPSAQPVDGAGPRSEVKLDFEQSLLGFVRTAEDKEREGRRRSAGKPGERGTTVLSGPGEPGYWRGVHPKRRSTSSGYIMGFALRFLLGCLFLFAFKVVPGSTGGSAMHGTGPATK